VTHATGQDPEGNLTITLDRDHRVVGFVVNRADAVRTPEALEASARRAYRAALVAQVREGRGASSGDRVRTAVATPAQVVPRSTALLQRHRVRSETSLHGRRTRQHTPEVGQSDNLCVRVELVPASPRGVIDADPGWLRQATSSQVSQSVQQAFARAYDRRER
jgi:hypothetical protein